MQQPVQHHSPVWSVKIDQGGGYVITKILVGPHFTPEAAKAEIERQQALKGPNGLPMLPLGKVSVAPRDNFKPLPPEIGMPLELLLKDSLVGSDGDE